MVFDYLLGHARHQADWATRAMRHLDMLEEQDVTTRRDTGVSHIRSLRS